MPQNSSTAGGGLLQPTIGTRGWVATRSMDPAYTLNMAHTKHLY